MKRAGTADSLGVMWVRLWAAVILAAAIVCATGCAKNTDVVGDGSNNREASMEPVISTSTNLEVVTQLFPSLEGAAAIETERLTYGGSESPETLPGPVDYQYRGYITLTDEAARKYATTYEFADNESPHIPFKTLEERSGEWKYSYEFCKDMIKPGLVGDVWLDGNTLLFSVGTM